MNRRDPMMRARDRDREQVIAVLDDAYADGQLSAVDRELRVGRAIEARTLGDLSGLTRDLQVASLPGPADGSARKRRLRIIGVAAAAGLLLLAGLSVGLLATDDPETAATVRSVPAEQVEQAPRVEGPIDEAEPEAQPTHPPLTKAWFESFLEDYREEFGDSRIWDATFYENGNVDFQRNHGPVRKNRMEHWGWTAEGGFTSNEQVDTNPFDVLPIELNDLALKPLLANLKHGRAYLGVEEPSMRVILERSQSAPTPVVEVRADNSFGEYGHLSTSLSGEVLETTPHDPNN